MSALSKITLISAKATMLEQFGEDNAMQNKVTTCGHSLQHCLRDGVSIRLLT